MRPGQPLTAACYAEYQQGQRGHRSDNGSYKIKGEEFPRFDRANLYDIALLKDRPLVWRLTQEGAELYLVCDPGLTIFDPMNANDHFALGVNRFRPVSGGPNNRKQLDKTGLRGDFPDARLIDSSPDVHFLGGLSGARIPVRVFLLSLCVSHKGGDQYCEQERSRTHRC